MSPLTKLFVVLLVVVSMLNAAAIVVFVEKAEPLQPMIDANKAQISNLNAEVAAARFGQQHAEEQVHTLIASADAAKSASSAAIATLQGQLNDAKVQQARLQADNTNLQTVSNTTATDAGLANKTVTTLQDQVTNLRATNDSLAKQNDEFSHRNAELSSTVDTMKAALDQSTERLAAVKGDNQKFSQWVKDHGGDPETVVAQAVVQGPGAPAINGVVRDKSVINGNTFVTISVGSADGVSKGMKFNVVDGPNFLGVVTVDTVDLDNSIGRLDGEPNAVSQVHQGDEVKTQLRD